MLRLRYYHQTHAKGDVYCKDRRVFRGTSETITSDEKLRELFLKLPHKCSWHEDDLEEVYHRYVHRAETMFGKDFQTTTNQTLNPNWNKKKAKEKKFEQLRQVKRKKINERKIVSNDISKK